jgi:helicase MOV-10
VTIVEAMLQLLKTTPTVKILACAPSNSAADLIAERLLEHVEAKKLFRFYAPSRSPESSKPIVLQCAYRPDGVTFGVPDATFVSKYRVVVTTCVGAAFARNIKMLPGHFSHIFVDEAGQGTEAEAMVSIKGMASTHTNIILSGDPKQLRPVIRSSVAAELGLGKSYLERLMEREVYDEAQGHGRTSVFASFPSFMILTTSLASSSSSKTLGRILAS